MTWGALGYLAAGSIVIVGAVVALRAPSSGRRIATFTASLIAAVVVGWFAWLSGTAV